MVPGDRRRTCAANGAGRGALPLAICRPIRLTLDTLAERMAAARRRLPQMTARRATFPPGPRLILSAVLYWPGRDPLGLLMRIVRTYGDVAYARFGGKHVFLVNHPNDVRDVFVTNQHNYAKGPSLACAKRVLGKGLLTSEGALHRRQRRLIQPAFHGDRIASYATVMADCADRVRSNWTDGTTVDVAREMTRLTLAVVAKALFDFDDDARIREAARAFALVMGSFWTAMLPFAGVIESLPIPKLRRNRDAKNELHAIIDRMIAGRRESRRDRADLLSMLLTARDEDGGGNDAQVHDEALTFLLTGGETTASALAWTWYLLSSSRGVEARLHEEIDRVLGGRLPTARDLASLPYLESVVTESLRLYPPAWTIERRAIQATRIGRYIVPAGSIIAISPYAIQRDPRWFADPDRFLPERWTPEFKAALPPFAYLPFGGGARRCIGDSFAWMELMLIVSTIAQQWRLRLSPGHPVVPQPVIALRMKHGLKMIPERRFSK